MPDLSKLSDAELAALYQQAKQGQAAQPAQDRPRLTGKSTPVPQGARVTTADMRAFSAPQKGQGGSGRPRKSAATPLGDAAASFALSGVPQGVTGVLGMPGDLADLLNAGVQAVGPKLGLDPERLKRAGQAASIGSIRKADLDAGVQSVFGEYHRPRTKPGEYAQRVGEFLPNALGPGGAVRKTAQVVAPALASKGAQDAVKAMGGGEKAQAVAGVVGAVLGGVPTVRPQRLPGAVAQQRPLKSLAKAAPQEVPAMRARQAEYAAAGLRPTFVDVVDEAGQGYLSGAALRLPARPAARAYGAQKRAGLPGEISAQARRVMSADPRNPQEIAEELATARNAVADQAYGAVRGEAFTMPPETVQALRSDYGRAAIAEAARRERDPETRAALLRLSTDALDNPSTPITVGMADRIARVLNSQRQVALRADDRDLAATVGGIADDVRNPARAAVPGYGQAVDGYTAGSRLIEAAARGEDFLARNTDEFAADMAGYSDAERVLPRATGRRAIERAAGESLGAAPGVAERLAYAPEQQARNRALLGEEDARRLEQGMGLAHESWRRAQAMSPSVGSPTAPKNVAADAVAGVIDTGVNAAQALHGNVVPMARQLLKAKGLDDQQAARLVQMATDPDQLEDVLLILEARIGQQGAQEFLRLAQEGGRMALPALATSPVLE